MVDILKIRLSLLKEIADGNKPKFHDYEEDNFTEYDFNALLLEMQKVEGLISGGKPGTGKGGRVIYFLLDNARVTSKGMEFLKDNSVLMTAYKGLKELRDWIRL